MMKQIKFLQTKKLSKKLSILQKHMLTSFTQILKKRNPQYYAQEFPTA